MSLPAGQPSPACSPSSAASLSSPIGSVPPVPGTLQLKTKGNIVQQQCTITYNCKQTLEMLDTIIFLEAFV